MELVQSQENKSRPARLKRVVYLTVLYLNIKATQSKNNDEKGCFMESKVILQGILVPMPTAFKEDGSLDE